MMAMALKMIKNDETLSTSTQEDLEVGSGKSCTRQFNYWIGSTRGNGYIKGKLCS
jgi:hypothetical protein